MCERRVCSPRGLFSSVLTSAAAMAVFTSTAMAATPDLSGQWGRDNAYFELPVSGPGPVALTARNADGTVLHAQVGDVTNPILKPQAAEAVKKHGESSLQGKELRTLHNRCWPEPPPYVLGAHFGVLIIQQPNEATLIYLLQNTVRHIT